MHIMRDGIAFLRYSKETEELIGKIEKKIRNVFSHSAARVSYLSHDTFAGVTIGQ